MQQRRLLPKTSIPAFQARCGDGRGDRQFEHFDFARNLGLTSKSPRGNGAAVALFDSVG
jgi:hypothetical protein